MTMKVVMTPEMKEVAKSLIWCAIVLDNDDATEDEKNEAREYLGRAVDGCQENYTLTTCCPSKDCGAYQETANFLTGYGIEFTVDEHEFKFAIPLFWKATQVAEFKTQLGLRVRLREDEEERDCEDCLILEGDAMCPACTAFIDELEREREKVNWQPEGF